MKKLSFYGTITAIFAVLLLTMLFGCTNYNSVFFSDGSDESVWLVERVVTVQYKNGIKYSSDVESGTQRFGVNGFFKFMFYKNGDVISTMRRGTKNYTEIIGSYRFSGNNIVFTPLVAQEEANISSGQFVLSEENDLVYKMVSDYNNGMIQTVEYYCKKIA